jgi:hypothetical protein
LPHMLAKISRLSAPPPAWPLRPIYMSIQIHLDEWFTHTPAVRYSKLLGLGAAADNVYSLLPGTSQSSWKSR